MRLAKAEAKRLFARRFTWIMLAVVVLLAGFAVLGVALNTEKRTPELIASVQPQIDDTRAEYERLRVECEEAAAEGSGEFGGITDCAEAFDPEQVDADWFLPGLFRFAIDARDLVMIAGFMLALFAFAVAASFIGAEWSTGSLANLLVWKPRRLPVLATKLAVVVGAVAVVGALFVAALLAVLYVVAAWRGDTSGLDADAWRILGLHVVRAIVLAVAAAVVGFTLASIGRHTAMALGVAIAYVVVVEVGFSIVAQLFRIAKAQQYQLSSYAFSWLEGGSDFTDTSHCDFDNPTSSQACVPVEWSLTLVDCAVVGGVIMLVLTAIAGLLFVRRDVT